jgi:hypothetical protein
MTAAGLRLFTIYDHPIDHPNDFIAREWVVVGSFYEPRAIAARGASLDEVRAQLPPGLARIDRSPEDDPKIVETWL